MTAAHVTTPKKVGKWYIGTCTCGAATQTPRARHVAESWGRGHVAHWRCPNGGPDHVAGVVGRKVCAWCDTLVQS